MADEYLWFDLGHCLGGASFEVTLRGSAANVFLVDAASYAAFVDGDEYEYFGGFTDISPVEVEVPYDDEWFLVVNGYEGKIKVSYQET